MNYAKLANTDYFDVMLMHYQHVATGPTDTVRWQVTEFWKRNRSKQVVGYGASVHGPARVCASSQETSGSKFAMIRMNHKGTQRWTPRITTRAVRET